MPYQFHFLPFTSLGSKLLYDILALRAQVFVVEQNAAYLDPDGLDIGALHLCIFEDEKLVGYARMLEPGMKFAEASIGRIVLPLEYRGKGLGKEIMRRSMKEANRLYGATSIMIEAQEQMQKFYESFGFMTISEPYDWGGIPHVRMLLAENKAA